MSVYNMDASEEDREIIMYMLIATPAQLFSGVFMILGCFLVFKDSLEGRYCPLHLMSNTVTTKSVQEFSLWQSIKLYMQI